ncbi:GntR family transcriptional regulator [Shewanella sp. OPT22]|nr:GntR family transcriptional regulator [Shewanella sp. OPT22]
MLDDALSNHAGKLILRLVLSILIIFHGVAKVMHPGSMGFISSTLTQHGLPTFVAYGVYIGEIVAPLMILIGFRTRIAAAIVVVNMFFVLGLVHMSQLFSVGDSGGYALELQFFYLFTALSVVFLGSGKFAYQPD